MAGGVCGHPGQFGLFGRRLRGHSACPENRHFTRPNFHSVSLVGLVDSANAYGFGVAQVNGGTVALGEALAD
jgi:hypothetical protein